MIIILFFAYILFFFFFNFASVEQYIINNFRINKFENIPDIKQKDKNKKPIRDQKRIREDEFFIERREREVERLICSRHDCDEHEPTEKQIKLMEEGNEKGRKKTNEKLK